MDMDQAAVFLAGSILIAIGFLVILAAVVIANNIIHKYWKSFGWKLFPTVDHEPSRFMTTEEAEALNGKKEASKKV
jgi:hypothetical protein